MLIIGCAFFTVNSHAERDSVGYWIRCAPTFPAAGFTRVLVAANLIAEDKLDLLFDLGCWVDSDQSPVVKEEDLNQGMPYYPRLPSTIEEMLDNF